MWISPSRLAAGFAVARHIFFARKINLSTMTPNMSYLSTGFHYEDIRMTICNSGRFIDSRVILDRHCHSHLHCHCVLCSARLTVVCRSHTPPSRYGIVVFKPCQNEYTCTWLGSMSSVIRMFSWLADMVTNMAEDPSRNRILKPHLQHIWDPHQLKWTPVTPETCLSLLQYLTRKLQCSQAGDFSVKGESSGSFFLTSVSHDVKGLHMQAENKHMQLPFWELTHAQPHTKPNVLYQNGSIQIHVLLHPLWWPLLPGVGDQVSPCVATLPSLLLFLS